MGVDYLSNDGGGADSSLYAFTGGGLPENHDPNLDGPSDAGLEEPLAILPAIAAAVPIAAPAPDTPAAIRKLRTPPGPVIAEAVDSSEDNDTATRQTIQMMCGYIKAAIADPYIRYLATGACRLFTQGKTDPRSAAWAVFWFLKHRVKKTYDEATMFKLGIPNQQDLLTDPRVLLRQKDAAEDCDGFTMSCASLLASLGADVCIVTVACDPADRTRWSHVFNMVSVPGPAGCNTWVPLDTSHGPRPGWMVPRREISRWQAWNLNGEPIEAKPPAPSTLHGYLYRPGAISPTRPGFGGRGVGGFRGLGDDAGTDATSVAIAAGLDPSNPSSYSSPITIPTLTMTPDALASLDSDLSALFNYSNPSDAQSVAAAAGLNPSNPSAYTGTGVNVPLTGSNSSPTWLTALLAGITGATKAASIAELPQGYVLNAQGQAVPAVSSVLSSLMPILLIGGGLLLVVSLMGSKK